MAVYLPRSLHARLHQQAADQDTTATARILLAVNRNHDKLEAALADELQPDTPRGGDLFVVPQARQAPEPTVQTTIRVTDPQRDALNELVAGLKSLIGQGVNRSVVITAAVRLDLA